MAIQLQSQLLRIPPEVIFHIAIDFLTYKEVLALIQCCSLLRQTLNNSQTLWSTLTYRRYKINYIQSAGDWKRVCFDPETAKLCPHLSDISDAVVEDRAKHYLDQYGSLSCVDDIKCSDASCSYGQPDLWMCMTKHCESTGCGRTKGQHAMLHYAAQSHHISLKINTLEVWCYQCIKWVGKRGKHPSEVQRVEQIVSQFLASNLSSPSRTIQSLQQHKIFNDRRHLEREMYQLNEEDKVYFLSVEFLLAWRKFLLGNEMPPENINNKSLVVNREDWAYVGSPDGLPGGLELMNPYMAPFHDFGIISEASWLTLCKYYGGGPAMSEDNIPKDNPVYFPLLQEIATGKQRIVDQCKGRKPNAQGSSTSSSCMSTTNTTAAITPVANDFRPPV